MVYIKNRQIIDGPMMIDEIIAWGRKKNKSWMFFKVDFEKAFDSLDWNFLDSVMTQMGFNMEKMDQWVPSLGPCIGPCQRLTYFGFSNSKRSSSRNPLSPFLFILVMEALHVTFQEAKSNNIFKGLKVGSDKVLISHLQFADDALIMGHRSLENVKNLSRILSCFYLTSRLKVFFSKSKIFGIGVSQTEVFGFASIIGLSSLSIPNYISWPTNWCEDV